MQSIGYRELGRISVYLSISIYMSVNIYIYVYIYILYLDRYHPGFTQTNNHEAYTDASYSSVIRHISSIDMKRLFLVNQNCTRIIILSRFEHVTYNKMQLLSSHMYI